MMRGKMVALLAGLVVVFGLTWPSPAQDKATEARDTLKAAQATLKDFVSDPNMSWIRDHLGSAKGVLIIPSQGKGGFIIAGSGGVGVLLARDAKGQWSQPAFYRMASVSVGLQAGGSASEVLLFVQSQKGVDSFLSSSFKLGADASVSAGPVGQGTQAATSDILAFSRSKGAFVGAAVEGSIMKPAEDLNKIFYKRDVTPVDILVRGDVTSDQSADLIAALTAVSKPKEP